MTKKRGLDRFGSRNHLVETRAEHGGTEYTQVEVFVFQLASLAITVCVLVYILSMHIHTYIDFSASIYI